MPINFICVFILAHDVLHQHTHLTFYYHPLILVYAIVHFIIFYLSIIIVHLVCW
jgi:hypothetical protein